MGTLHLVVLRKGSLPSFKLVTIVLRWRGMGGPGEWAVDVKDVTPLMGEAGKAKCSRPKFFLWLVSILSVCLLIVGTGYWFYWKDVVGLRVNEGYIITRTRRPMALAGRFFLNFARTAPLFPWERVTLPQITRMRLASLWPGQAVFLRAL